MNEINEEVNINKKRYTGMKCITICNNNISVEEKTPYIRLLLNVFQDDGIAISYAAILHNKEIMEKAFSMLSKNEADVLRQRYGIWNMDSEVCGKPLVQVAELYGVSVERIRGIEAKALRKLRHPSRNKILIGENFEDMRNVRNEEYLKQLKENLSNEIIALVGGRQNTFVYLDKILDRYKISITREIPLDYDIEKLNLSVRSYNCLKRAGINTISDLIELTDEQLRMVRNLSNKCCEEIKQRVDQIYENGEIGNNLCIDGGSTIIFEINGEKIVYKYLGMVPRQIGHSIFCMLQNIKPLMTSLFEIQISPRLMEFLTMKGYLFWEDVLADADKLIEQLRICELNESADEMQSAVNEENNKKIKVYLYQGEETIRKFIGENEFETASDIVLKAQNSDNEDVRNFAKQLMDMGFEVQ